MMDQYRTVIEGWLDEDARSWRKERHTAARIHARLRDEYGCEASESTVRHYVARLKAEHKESKESFLALVWAPEEETACAAFERFRNSLRGFETLVRVRDERQNRIGRRLS